MLEYSILQTPDVAIDYKNPEPGRRANLDVMLSMMDRSVSSFGRPVDLFSFAEMPLHGFGEWNRAQMLKVAIELPGPETEALGQKAKEMSCYISFGSYVRDKDWPDHVIMMGVLIGPDGEIAAQHWKARGTLGGLGLFTSTVYECFDRYVEMYGADEIIPVARTDIGNICMSGVQFDPMLYGTMALKGAEMLCRFATGEMQAGDGQYVSRAFNLWTGFANSANNPNHRFYASGAGRGLSCIISPSGEIVAQADKWQGAIRHRIPMAAFRENRSIPYIQWPLYEPVLSDYTPKFDKNWFLKYPAQVVGRYPRLFQRQIKLVTAYASLQVVGPSAGVKVTSVAFSVAL